MNEHLHFLIDKITAIPTKDGITITLQEISHITKDLFRIFYETETMKGSEVFVKISQSCIFDIFTNLSPISILDSEYCASTGVLSCFKRNLL